MKRKQTVSHRDVRDAVQQFVKQGGMIAKLPDQKQIRDDYVGAEKHDTYEPLSTFVSSH